MSGRNTRGSSVEKIRSSRSSRSHCSRQTNRLPSENDLALQFDLNRHNRATGESPAWSARRRLKRGRGSYLVPGIIDYPSGERTGFSTTLPCRRAPSHTFARFSGERLIYGRRRRRDMPRWRKSSPFSSPRGGEADKLPIIVAKRHISARRQIWRIWRVSTGRPCR